MSAVGETVRFRMGTGFRCPSLTRVAATGYKQICDFDGLPAPDAPSRQAGLLMNDTAAITSTGLEHRLRSGQFVMTAEVAPPVSCDPEDLLQKALPLRGLADAVNVTDGAGARAHMSATAAAA